MITVVPGTVVIEMDDFDTEVKRLAKEYNIILDNRAWEFYGAIYDMGW